MDSGAVLSLCKKYGPTLALPKGTILSAIALMCAFAENESSFGANCTPRHEQAYDFGGKYSTNPEQAALLEKYGSRAAYSYGIWQILPCNASGLSPDVLESQPEVQALAFVHHFNKRVMPHVQTIGEMGQVYNAGQVTRPPRKLAPGVIRYVAKLQMNYAIWFQRLKEETDHALADA